MELAARNGAPGNAAVERFFNPASQDDGAAIISFWQRDTNMIGIKPPGEICVSQVRSDDLRDVSKIGGT